MKLSKAQQEVVDKMREGQQLVLIFSSWINRSPTYDLNEVRVNSRTIESLKDNKVIEYSHKTHGGNIRHYYRLTEQYKNEQK